jgi:hypothetical protein
MASNSANRFMSSFQQGFSFVDDINSRRRQEAKLDEELARRRMLDEARESRAQKTFDLQIEETNRVRGERAMGQAGDQAALDLSVNIDDVIHLAPFSEQLRSRIVKERGEAELLKALQSVRDNQPQPSQTGGVSAGGLSGQVGNVAANANAAADANVVGQSQLGASQGRDSLTSVDLDELSDFDPAAPQGSFLQRILGEARENREGAINRVTGGLRGLSVAAANTVNRGANAVFGTDLPPVQSGASFGTEMGGNILVPEAFTTEQEFAEIQDPTEFEARRKRNTQIIEDLKASEGDPEASRLDQLRTGSREAQAEARRQEFVVTQRYEGFSDPTIDNKFRELAAEDPQAAVTQYFKDRATLKSASPSAVKTMDMHMQPVIKATNQQYSEQLNAAVVGTREHALATRQLRNLQATQAQIVQEYSPSEASGIDSRGIPIGNSQLTQNLMLAVNDPNRPRPVAPAPGRELATAGTITARMGGSRRATDTQIKNAIKLKDAGMASAEDVMTLTMTGRWPDKSPAAQLKAYKPGDVVYSQGPDGSVRYAFTVPGGKTGTTNRNGTGEGQYNLLTQEMLSNFVAGAQTVFPEGQRGSEEMINDMVGVFMDDSDWIQENYDLRDPIAANRIGRAYSQAVTLSAEEDSFWIPNFIERWVGEAPSAQEIMRSPDMAARLAVEHEIPMPLLPEQRFAGIDINNMREELSIPGKYPAVLAQAANPESGITDEQLIEIVRRYDALTSQQSGQ